MSNKNLTATQTAALAYLQQACTGRNSGHHGYVRTATARALQLRGLIIAAPTRPGDLFERGYMRCIPTPPPTLRDYQTGDFLRDATPAELEASKDAAKHDGGAGVIIVRGIPCYVQD